MHETTPYDKEYPDIQIGQIIGSYTILEQLGRGTYGVVYKAKKDTQEVAIKFFRNTKLYRFCGKVEMQCLKKLNNTKNVVTFIEHFDTEEYFCIITEFLETSLLHTIYEKISIDEFRVIASQLLCSLHQMKQQEIIHCDIKIDNIMWRSYKRNKKECDAVFIDFSSSFFSHEKEQIKGEIQSMLNRAPEIASGEEGSFAIDMWSLGCVLVELLIKRPLFLCNNNKDLLYAINELLNNDKENLKKMLKEHPTFYDLISKMLEVDPLKRITPEDALKHNFFQYEETDCKYKARPAKLTKKNRTMVLTNSKRLAFS